MHRPGPNGGQERRNEGFQIELFQGWDLGADRGSIDHSPGGGRKGGLKYAYP